MNVKKSIFNFHIYTLFLDHFCVFIVLILMNVKKSIFNFHIYTLFLITYPHISIYLCSDHFEMCIYCADSVIRPVWSESSMCAEWVAKSPRFLYADSEDSDQTGRMPRLIWVFAGRTVSLLVLSCRSSCIFIPLVILCMLTVGPVIFEPRHEKTCLQGLRPGKTRTGLLSYRS